MPDTLSVGSRPNEIVPSRTPSKPAGISNRVKATSRCINSAFMPRQSITSNSGSMIAAACGTGTVRAINGVASAPKPEPKPLLEMPTSSTAGMAAAKNQGSVITRFGKPLQSSGAGCG